MRTLGTVEHELTQCRAELETANRRAARADGFREEMAQKLHRIMDERDQLASDLRGRLIDLKAAWDERDQLRSELKAAAERNTVICDRLRNIIIIMRGQGHGPEHQDYCTFCQLLCRLESLMEMPQQVGIPATVLPPRKEGV